MDQVAVEFNALLGWLRTFNLSSEVSEYKLYTIDCTKCVVQYK